MVIRAPWSKKIVRVEHNNSLTPQILLLGLVYAILGLAGLTLAIPPGYATAIFPAAGVAVVAILHSGWRLVPGVWAGSVFINLWVFQSHGALHAEDFLVASLIGAGSSIQALAGALLVRWRLGNAWKVLDQDGDILWFLLIAGPLACLVSASWGNAMLIAFGIISASQFAFSWWNWWVGDTIGVLLFAPLTLMILQRGSPVWRSRMRSVGGTSLVAMTVILVVFLKASRDESEQIMHRIEERGASLFSEVKSSFRSYSELVIGLAGFVRTMPDFTNVDFERFTREALGDHPNLQALGWNPIIRDGQRSTFEQAMSREMYSSAIQITEKNADGKLVPAARRDHYVVVRYIMPLAPNRAALGYDIGSDSIRLAAIEAAIGSRQLTVTDPIRLVQETGSSAGVLLLNPVYLDRGDRESRSRQGLIMPDGFAVGVLRIEDIVRDSITHILPAGLIFKLSDQGAAGGMVPLYDSSDGASEISDKHAVSSDFFIGGRYWRMSITPTVAFLAANRSLGAWGVLAVGLILASFLQAMLLGITGRASVIRKRVDEQTQDLSEKERFLRLSQENGRIGTWEIDFTRHTQSWSRNCVELLGLRDLDRLSWDGFLQMVVPEDREQFTRVAGMARAEVDQVQQYELEYRLIRGDKQQHWMRSAGQIERDPAGNVCLIRGVIQDIDRRKQTHEELRLAHLVYQNCSEGMLVTDARNRIIAVNPAFSAISGYSLEEVRGRDPSLLSSGRQSKDFYREMWLAINSRGQWQGELWNRNKYGEAYAVWLTINTIHTPDGDVDRHVALFSDITGKKNADAIIWAQANYDDLTQLPNRRLFTDRLEQELKKAHRDRQRFALLFIDLDHFKEVNDTLGHDVGDELLAEAAKRIQGRIRASDTVARLGGDEFTVILSDLSDPLDAERIADCVLQVLLQPFQLPGGEVFISASIGCTHYPEDAHTVSGLLKNADQAMYVAKRSGRNRLSRFTQDMRTEAQQHMRLAKDLRTALANNQLLVHYQPIVDLSSGEIQKAEALMRWNHPELGMIPPALFIPIAEEIGMIHDMGDWIYQQSVQQVLRWQQMLDGPFQVSVNKSPVQFENGSTSKWIDYLRAMGGCGQSIVVEITEGLLLNSDINTLDKLLQYRDSGIQVAIDDFGTGYSALAYLNKFDIDYLKIDRSFVSNLDQDNEEMALCEAIVAMAHKLGLKVIAEGVETDLQLALLSQIGCDYGQGYLFSRPLPANQFDELLKCHQLSVDC